MLLDVGKLLETLLGKADFVYLTRHFDGESASFYVSLRQDDCSRAAERATLAEALLALHGEPVKRCSRCRQVKPLSHYQWRDDGGSRDGHTSHCKQCNRERLKKFYPRAARKKKRPADGAEPPPPTA